MRAARPGVVPAAPSPPTSINPKALDKPMAGEATGDVTPSPLEDVVTFKSNYEKDVKCRKLPLNAKINIDFEDASIEDLVKFIGCITEKNFLIANPGILSKKITIMSPKPVTVYEAYRAFLASLEANGLTIVPSGKFLKIVEMGKAKTDTLPIYGAGQEVPREERLVTRFVQLENVSTDEMVSVLGHFKTASGDIFPYPPTNTLIITDTGANLERMLKVLEQLDVPTGKERIWLRPVQYAEASEIAQKLQEIFQVGEKGPARPRTPQPRRATPRRRGTQTTPTAPQGTEPTKVTISKIIADDRTNQLIIVATRSSYFKVDRLIRKLDVPIPGEGQIHIYYLENADAEDIASTLQSLTQASSRGGSAAAQARARRAARARGRTDAARGRAGEGGVAALFEGEVKISPHKETNSLVIESSLKDFLALKKVIQKLDVPRKQVYIEAVIMEISSNKDTKLGISGSAGATFNIGGNDVPLLIGLGGLGISGFDPQQLSDGGLAVGLQGPLVDIDPGSLARLGTGTLSIPTFGFIIQALQSNSDVNFISTPHILTTDNEEAEIQVGTRVPYRSATLGLGGLGSLGGLGGIGGLGTTGNVSTTAGLGSLGALGALGALGGYGTVQFVDVDLTLKITPHVNESHFVRLEIEQELEEIESLDPNLGPTTSKRRVKNTVVVRDQQPIVIGGLIRDVENEGVNKVPFLGDIPLIGHLFRRAVRRIEKRNLLMVIVPTIIDHPSDLKRIREERMQEMRDFAEMLATKKKEYLGQVDYRKKRGVIDEMFRFVDRLRRERELEERTRLEESELDVIGPPETHDLEYDPFAAEQPPAAGGAPRSQPTPAPAGGGTK